MQLRTTSGLLGAIACGGLLGIATPAAACGGFFCSQVQPVNQAAERIIFADNGDGTQTAVIEILYDGPSESFSWLLPISSVPQADDLVIASSAAFQRLQAATNPVYSLTTRLEGECKPSPVPPGRGVLLDGAPEPGGDPSVQVDASGVVGSFEWTVISVDPAVDDAAGTAVDWLNGNGYDVPGGAPALLRPYLQEGLHLLALRLTKGATTGSIRPIAITYAADRASIPIKLTAVAANENMGVMAWVLGKARAVPQNYLSLELNEARINWFNPGANYGAVVSEAADDAGGQGFVTELSEPAAALSDAVWSLTSDEAIWQAFKLIEDPTLMLQESSQWSGYDGYWDAVRGAVTLSGGLTFEDLQACPYCNNDLVTVDAPALVAALEKDVIEPVRYVQRLIDSHSKITRLYTTMSADEMTLDPVFTFNPDLADVSNQHTAERVVECNPSLLSSEANWRIELPQGGTVRGRGADVASGTWPAALDDLPPNLLIQRVGETGEPKTVEDNREAIDTELDAYNSTVPAMGQSVENDGGCSVTHARSGGAWLALLGVVWLGLRRRSARHQRW